MMLKQCATGTFPTYQKTEVALSELKGSGFSMDKVSVVGRDANGRNDSTGVHTTNRLEDASNNQHTDDNQSEETAAKGAVAGSTLGGLTGLLVGLGVLAIPGIGPVMLAGAAATAIATTISGGMIGAAAGTLMGGLVGLGIPEDRAKSYSDKVSDGDYLVMIQGSQADIAQAESILSNHGIEGWYVYDSPSNSLESEATVSNHPQNIPNAQNTQTLKNEFPAHR